MRGLYSSKTIIRHKIFTEIARMAYEGSDPSVMETLPYKIVPGEMASYRESIFLERAVVGERLRVAMGMSLRPVSEHAPIAQGVEASVISEKYYEPPLINVIKFACNACPEKKVFVTEGCQGCLEHPCKEVCPKGAITMVNGKSHIDEEKCIKCGKCVQSCPYNAIIKQERPCSKACGMNAIGSDEHGRAEIDQDKCVSCGMCLVSCPFSAIVDKGQIFQTILAMKTGVPVYAIVAPAVAGQFGPDMKPEKIAVEADPGQIAQVVRNLIDNAIKFTPEGGSLWLITKVKKKVVTVTVKDSGKGIDADSIPHLFERFYKAEKAHTPGESAGTGLGLAIVKRIIDQHDQDITVEAEPGKGTSFTFTLNAAERSVKGAAQKKA